MVAKEQCMVSMNYGNIHSDWLPVWQEAISRINADLWPIGLLRTNFIEISFELHVVCKNMLSQSTNGSLQWKNVSILWYH